MKLGELLNSKDFMHRDVVSVGPDDSVAIAIEKMNQHDRGALPVRDNKGDLAGIITERDIVRRLFAIKDGSAQRTKVRDIMSSRVAIGNPNDDVSYAINVMAEKRIRHLPIVDGRDLIGMISMRDLLRVQLEVTRTEVKYMSDYISGGHV